MNNKENEKFNGIEKVRMKVPAWVDTRNKWSLLKSIEDAEYSQQDIMFEILRKLKILNQKLDNLDKK